MARPKKLPEDEIVRELQNTTSWTRVSEAIERDFVFANFLVAVQFIQALAVLAEEADHHPDIFLHHWNHVRITLSTHDQGGLTVLDFALARRINELFDTNFQ